MASYRYRSSIEGLYTLRSLIEGLYTLNSPPAVSFTTRVPSSGFVGAS